MRISYWSNSKFAKWVRATFDAPQKPTAGTWDEWVGFEEASKEFSPLTYWFTDEFLDKLQDVIYWPKDKLESVSYWAYNRFIEPTHLIRTGLSKGKYHETEEKILHGIFAEVVDFVEIQKASMQEDYDRWYRKYLPYFINKLIPLRNQQAGINYLLWEISLRKDDEWFGYTWRKDDEQVEIDKANNPEYMKQTPQAENATRLLDAYCWWKFVRPRRSDPWDASGYTEYTNKLEQAGISLFSTISKESEENAQICREYLNNIDKIETQYFDEDTFYLKEIIEIRSGLWT